jgi:uncharacterized protein (TIRG00374 family)
MRKLIVAIVLMIGVMFILTRFAQIEDIHNTLSDGDWRFLALAFLVELLWIVNIGASFSAIFRLLGVSEKFPRLILLAMAANFVNIVAPSGGIGGIAIFISDARQRDYSAGRATVASTLFVLFDYLGFLTILTLGFGVLIRRDQVTTAEITASIIIVLIAAALVTLLYLGSHSEVELAAVLTWLAKHINRLARPFRKLNSGDYLSLERSALFAHEIAAGLKELRRSPKDLVYPFLLAINSKVLWIVLLYFVFLAFNVTVTIGTVIAGFCVAFLFMIVSPTPSGVGIVEGLLTLALSSFHIPLGTAAVITLAYRGFTFWIPLFIGLPAFRWASLQKTDTTPETAS